MAKISRRMKKALALGLGVAALSKMGGAGTAAANIDSGRGGKTASAIARAKTLKGDNKMATARKLMTSDAAGKVAPAAKTIKSSSPFKMFGVKEMPSESNIEKFKAANQRQVERRAKMSGKMKKVSEGPSLLGFRFEKPLFKSGGSVMAKCKLGRNKKTKIY
jgi:hypothetical protein